MHCSMYGGTQKHQNVFIKNCVFILKCLNFSHLQSTLHLIQYTYWDVFSIVLNSFWTCRFWCLLVLLLFFVLPLPRWQNVSLWRLFSSRETKKVTLGEIRWIGRVGHQGHAIFGQKLLNTQCGVGRCARKSPIMKWVATLKESSKEIHWSWTQPLTTMPAGALIQVGS